jgi:alkylhydroperoxidase family enzyme
MHTEMARVESGHTIDADHAASFRPQVAAVLPLLEKVSRTPEKVDRSDVDAVRAAGVPDDAIVDALYVNFIFNCVNRLANALGFTWDSDDHVRLNAKVLHRISYRLPGLLMR